MSHSALQALALSGETVLLAVWLAFLFHERRLAGGWPFYLSVVMLQPIGLLLGPMVYVDLPFGISGNPGTLVVYPANLFVVLLVYIREDALEVRRLLLGLLGANLTFTLLWFVFGLHLQVLGGASNNPTAPLQRTPTPILLLSAALLLADAVLAIVAYEALSRRLRVPLFVRIWMALAVALAFDEAVFGSVVFLGRPEIGRLILAALLGKWLASLIYAAVLAAYLSYAATPPAEASVPPGPRLGFGALTYRQRYEAQRSESRRALARRDAILAGVGFAAERFLKGAAWEENIGGVLERLGRATAASRVYLFENRSGARGEIFAAQRFEWAAEGVPPQIDNPALREVRYLEAGFERWQRLLSAGETIHGMIDELPACEVALLRSQGILSLAAVPVFAGERFWGFMGFDDCVAAHAWSGEELAALRAAAGTLGAAIDRATTLSELRESEQRYRLHMEHAPEAIVVLDVDAGRFVDANLNAERLFKMERAELLEKAPADLSPLLQPDGRESSQAASEWISRAVSGETPAFDWVHRDALGNDIVCEVRLVTLPARGRRLVRGSVTDVTERRLLDEQLRQAQKMEGVGLLAGGIAHDFNNLLTAVLGYAAMARRTLAPESPAGRHIDQIKRAAERAAELTRQLLAFARKQIVKPRVLDMNDVLTQMAPMLERLIGEEIHLETQASPAACLVKADRSQLEQLLMNLAVNARDAMPGGGRLVLRTEPRRVDSVGSHKRDGATPGDYVVLSVADTGQGMEPEVRRRAFEPFYTTKEVGKGTGLGLSTCEGIVAQSGGFMEVDSEPGHGSEFRVYLPACREPERTDAALPTEVQPALGGTETLLVVEDDALVRGVTVDTLAGMGYRVLEATNGKEALERLNRERGIQLLITDVIMPHMGGRTLVESLRPTHPDLPVLFVSGYGQDIAGEDGSLPAGTAFLMKPFTASRLAEKVRELISSGATS